MWRRWSKLEKNVIIRELEEVGIFDEIVLDFQRVGSKIWWLESTKKCKGADNQTTNSSDLQSGLAPQAWWGWDPVREYWIMREHERNKLLERRYNNRKRGREGKWYDNKACKDWLK